MIGGFIIASNNGSVRKSVVRAAMGPSLAKFGLTPTCYWTRSSSCGPTAAISSSGAVVGKTRRGPRWKTPATNLAAIADPLSLPPYLQTSYTAILSGNSGATGIGAVGKSTITTRS